MPMTFEPYLLTLGLQALGGLGIGLAILWIYRRIHRQSTIAANIFAGGLLLRAFLGVVLFWISYLDLSFLGRLHRGDGYWSLAPDAFWYMTRAATAATEGLDTIMPRSASPSYVMAVALWMRLVGMSPISGMFLNLFMYCVLCALLVYVWKPTNDWRAHWPLLALLAAFSLSPVHVIHGSQSLKDDVFSFIIVLGAVGVFFMSNAVASGARTLLSSRRAVLAGLAAWLAAIYGAAGIRAYFAFFMTCSLTAILGLWMLRLRRETLFRQVIFSVAVAALSVAVYVRAAGPHDLYLSRVSRILVNRTGAAGNEGMVAMVLRRIDQARAGFARSGGDTNLVSTPLPPPESAAGVQGNERSGGRVRATLPMATTPQGYARRLGMGLATLFIPISALEALSIVDIDGGGGLLFVTDIDTLFVDATLLLTFVVLYMRWDAVRRRLPFVSYLFLLGGTTSLLLAYVVTNFGTQFRLRMLAVVPLWLMILATMDRDATPADLNEDPRASPPTLPGTTG
ncbi:MAG: hypothetical protein AB7F99_07475 [Vicinamibacterales bacterium]